jgi:hypothetical protein
MSQVSILLTLNRILSRAGAAVAVLFLFFLADNFISGRMSPSNVLRTIPGNTQPISGDLITSVTDTNGLAFSTDNPHLSIEFAEARGKLWRGALKADANARPGDYQMRVWVSGKETPDKVEPFRILVFADQKRLQTGDPSLTRRFIGISPLWMVLVSLFLVSAALAGSFYLSMRHEGYLARNGIVPIMSMTKRKQGWEIQFALGSSQGVAQGDELIFLNDRFKPSGRFKVDQLDQHHSTATIPFDVEIAPSWWVVKNTQGGEFSRIGISS